MRRFEIATDKKNNNKPKKRTTRSETKKEFERPRQTEDDAECVRLLRDRTMSDHTGRDLRTCRTVFCFFWNKYKGPSTNYNRHNFRLRFFFGFLRFFRSRAAAVFNFSYLPKKKRE